MVVTLNRPEIRNALNDAMTAGLCDSLDQATSDPQVRCMVLTGAGDAFCSGADTRKIARGGGVFEGSDATVTRHGYAHGIQRLTRAFAACEVPIIAAVNGPALGLGFDITLQCDIRVAARNAIFSEAFISVGLIPGDGGFWYLPRIVGYSRAVEMTVTGRRVDAETAERWGLVSEVVDKGAALDAALALAQEVAEKSPQAVRLSKRLIRDAQVSTLENALSMGSMAQAVVTGSPDQREAVAALIGKRPAKFG